MAHIQMKRWGVISILVAIPMALFLLLLKIENTKNDIREAIVRDFIRYKRREICFLATGSINYNVDPSDGLMARFSGEARFRKFSQGASVRVPRRPTSTVWQDKVSREEGFIYWIGPIEWLNFNKAIIEGGSIRPKGRCILRYEVHRRSSLWHVNVLGYSAHNSIPDC